MHKRRHTGGKRKALRKKRKFELGRPPANTKLGEKRIHLVRTRGGNEKRRGIRLDHGNFSWGSEVCTKKVRILDVVYNASNNELVRTKTLVKGAIVQIDAQAYKAYYLKHYGLPASTFGGSSTETAKVSRKVQRKLDARAKGRALSEELKDQLKAGRFLACISSRPGQSGRADGYILEGPELAFYKRKLRAR